MPPLDSPEFAALCEWSTGEDERAVARTEDGWNIQLYRYRAQESGERVTVPVLMSHGFAGSRLIFDVHPDYSPARYLAAHGFDVWLVDLRGRNESWPDGGPHAELHWTFDDFVAYDIPAAVRAVRARTGATSVRWVGQEMSGIAAYALAVTNAVPELRCAVTLGSPAVTPSTAEVPGVTTELPGRDASRVVFSMVQEVGPLLAAQQSEFLESSFRPANTDWVVTARYFRNGVPDESTAIADQFIDWMQSGTMRNLDGTLTYSERLGEVTMPMLLMVGVADLQRPPDAVRATFDALGSRDKTFVRAGVADGYSFDFGHDDLIAGLRSPAEIYPVIADWLASH